MKIRQFLIAAIVLFVVGLKGLSHPESARRGNLLAAAGMILGIIITLFYPFGNTPNNYGWIAGGAVVGGVIGYLAAIKVKMTKMPELVSLFNGFGGASAALIGLVAFSRQIGDATQATDDDVLGNLLDGDFPARVEKLHRTHVGDPHVSGPVLSDDVQVFRQEDHDIGAVSRGHVIEVHT